jgi:hypothetical protein
VVDFEYTDNRCCYKVVYNSFQRRQRVGRSSSRCERVCPTPRIPTLLAAYGMISRWYAAGKAARARCSALEASASESKRPVKTT